jgi:hypothetical protein
LRKPDFDHVIASAAQICGEDEIVVIGSQSIWGSVEDPPETMVRSLEADIYPRRDPSRAEEIDGLLGDGSQFQLTYGYYAHGVGPETAKAPAGWEDRLVGVEVPRRPGEEGHVRALCLERHDLILAKCAAGRERDWEFAKAALSVGIVELAPLLALIDRMPIRPEDQIHLRAMLEGIQKQIDA